MTKFFDQALETVRRLPATDQDDIARLMLQFAGAERGPSVPLSEHERGAVAISKAAARRGEFATDDQVRSVWAKHGL